MSTEPLRRLGKYDLLQSLGHGGMAEVWKARDTQLQRYVAIKLLHPNLQADPDFVTRFQREAQAIASLRHPNIVQIHDFQVSPFVKSDPQGRSASSVDLTHSQGAPFVKSDPQGRSASSVDLTHSQGARPPE